MPDAGSTIQGPCDSDAGGRFVQLRAGALDQWCRQREVPPADRAVLAHLLLEADWRTGVVHGFSLTRCSAELGLGAASGRRTLSTRLLRLAAAGAIAHNPPVGKSPGSIRVLVYSDMVRTSRPQARAQADLAARNTRAQADLAARNTRAQADLAARNTRAQADLAARNTRAQAPEFHLSPGVSPAEDLEDVDNPTERLLSVVGAPIDVDRLCFELVLRLDAAGDILPPVTDADRRAAGEVLARAGLEEALAVLAFATGDAFWSGVVRSMAKFAKHFDQLRARARAASRPARPVNPLTAPTEDRTTCGLVSL